ncbi:MAG: Mrp/NBP35 family ATP-binding protein [Cytophagales bacterium]|nr:Mrp/NBP35 family ATP-binding protein [Bernardetiaceae bacterium]MDW8210440.1 Mrp/NBP35 family ATP-binding protein [Cytophagales bacterium]
MTYTTKEVLRALSHVQEPDLKRDIVSLGMVRDVEIADDSIRFAIVLTTPACPLKEVIRQECEQAIAQHLSPSIKVHIHFMADVTTLRNGEPLLPKVKNIVAIASGKGGVGKSTVTANLAIALEQTGAKVGIIDADIFGPSIPTMFNCEAAHPGIVRKGDRNYLLPVEQYGIKLLSIGFLAPAENAVVWRGPMASSALRQFITDTEWGELDYLLVDLPPGTSDIHLTLVQTVPLTGAVIVTTPQKVALSDAQKALAMFRQKPIDVPILGIVENMSYFTPAELPDHQYYLFGKDGGKMLARRNEVPFLGEIPLVQSIREAGDSGKPIAMSNDMMAKAFKQIAAALAQRIALRNAQMEVIDEGRYGNRSPQGIND